MRGEYEVRIHAPRREHILFGRKSTVRPLKAVPKYRQINHAARAISQRRYSCFYETGINYFISDLQKIDYRGFAELC